MKKVSVVIPCYNEALNIPELYERLVAMFTKAGYGYQIIFVENGSKDDSQSVLRDLANKDPHVTVPVLSRNFGPQGAYYAGMSYATGDGVVVMDGDLQDPPEMIADFIKKWEEGYDIVYGVRTRRKGSLFRRIGYKLFYRLMKKMSYLDIPLDAGEFSLIDRRVSDILRALPERDRWLRGLRTWAGFSHTGVPYVRPDRKYGETQTSLMDNFHWAMVGLFSFSYVPLQWISYLSFLFVGLSGMGISYYVAVHFIAGTAPQGFASLMIVVLFLGGIQLLCLSIIGQYIGRIFEEIKQRPIYVIDEVMNDTKDSPPESLSPRHR